ncbi:hypothetical protein GIB67_036302 [Kingdonia uniflora]|uniref:Uncharacterized protein n=1 Tax=Kingdonia uniflora TaxID=39325 RepID=A0A7J7L3R6_9MAGN|nr:hypothetical protein GIB67_036302 [Kingdonia uniflora]
MHFILSASPPTSPRLNLSPTWHQIYSGREGGKKKVHITNELDDVIDNEEDDDWKQWGKNSKSPEYDFDPSSLDFSNMNPLQVQSEMMKHHQGPSFGFAKLRFGVRRSLVSELLYSFTPFDIVADIVMGRTMILKTGSVDAKFMEVNLSIIMFTMEIGQGLAEQLLFIYYQLKEFVLSQPEAYEIKIGDRVHQRLGDPPLDEFIETLRNEHKSDNQSPVKDDL